nr:N-acetylmuramoyl-L-alanine amidase [uncultured Prevotella sp.]
MFSKNILSLVAMWLLLVLNAFSANKRFTLVIDAGHGGHDAGALGTISKEKDINLLVALAFGRYVERNQPDVRVVYTRKTDVFIPLKERANIANRANADLFISVHTNALPAGKIARGFETYTLGMHRAKDNLDVAMRENSVISMEKGYQQTYQGFDPRSSESYIIFEFIQGKNMERSVELARMIQKSVCTGANRPNKGVHQAGFLVLRETSMPGCLIELGFITTPDEEQLLNSTNRVDDIARGIYQAFAQYKDRYDKGVSVPYRPTDDDKAEVPTIVPSDYKEEKAPAVAKPATRLIRAAQPRTASVRKVEEQEHKQNQKKVVKAQNQTKDAPVFKVQILASSRVLRTGDSHLKGETEYDSYQENGMVKYTMGASTNYNEIYRLRKSLLEKFPEAFIIAFKNGQKYDVGLAIREYKQNKNK